VNDENDDLSTLSSQPSSPAHAEEHSWPKIKYLQVDGASENLILTPLFENNFVSTKFKTRPPLAMNDCEDLS
jgi:hypothetical protein